MFLLVLETKVPTSCIHCKTCDIKAPAQDINWQVSHHPPFPLTTSLPSQILPHLKHAQSDKNKLKLIFSLASI